MAVNHLVSFCIFLVLSLSEVSSLSLPVSHAAKMAALKDKSGFEVKRTKAVIIGGGPVGLVTSLVLSQRHSYDVTLIEQREMNAFESEKAYLYLLDGRGQRATKLVPGLTESIQQNSVPSSDFTALVEVLPDGKQNNNKIPVRPMKDNVEKYWIPRNEMLQLLISEIEDHNSLANDDSGKIKMMYGNKCSNIDIDQNTGKAKVSIEYQLDECKDVDLVLGCDGINSKVRDYLSTAMGSNSTHFDPISLESDAGGLYYKMLTPKQCFPLPVEPGKHLSDYIEEEEIQHGKPSGNMEVSSVFATYTDDTSITNKPRSAQVTTSSTDDGDKRVAVLPSLLDKVNQMLPFGNKPQHQHHDISLVPSKAYAIRGTAEPSSGRALSIGLLPVKDKHVPRTCNFIAYPDHDIFSITTEDEMKTYFEKQFPQISGGVLPPLKDSKSEEKGGIKSSVDLYDFVDREEFLRFVAAKTGRFPHPQYCNHLHAKAVSTKDRVGKVTWAIRDHKNADDDTTATPVNSSEDEREGAQFLLLGDAAHAFPPDLGQGVNSGLEDVFVLDQTLSAASEPALAPDGFPLSGAPDHKPSLSYALIEYEAKRRPELKALIKLMVFGFPYQYRQGSEGNKKYQNSLLNFVFRSTLHKILPFIFYPCTFEMIQTPSLSYSTILKRARHTTHRLKLIAIWMVSFSFSKVMFKYSAAPMMGKVWGVSTFVALASFLSFVFDVGYGWGRKEVNIGAL